MITHLRQYWKLYFYLTIFGLILGFLAGWAFTALGAESTFYPNSTFEISNNTDNQSWADKISTDGNDNGDTRVSCTNITNGTNNETWGSNVRGIISFDTSSLPDDAVVSSSTLYITGKNKTDGLSITPSIVLVEFSGNADTPSNSDYTSFGSTDFSSVITYANFSQESLMGFTLNTNGKSFISNNGQTNFGCINYNYDFLEVAPDYSSASSYLIAYNKASSSTSPFLVVEWSTSSTPTTTPTSTPDDFDEIGFWGAVTDTASSMFTNLFGFFAFLIGTILASFIMIAIIRAITRRF